MYVCMCVCICKCIYIDIKKKKNKIPHSLHFYYYHWKFGFDKRLNKVCGLMCWDRSRQLGSIILLCLHPRNERLGKRLLGR